MSDTPFASNVNPYQAPMVTTYASDVGGSDPTLDRVADMLRQTKPWVRFISVMMFIAGALMVLFGLFFMVGGAARMPIGLAGFGIVYIVIAIIYIIPAVFLWMYADRMAVFLRNKSSGTLASALEAQKSFWKFMGILTLIILCLYGLAIFAVFVGVAAMR
jgi:hypothetical protein